MSESYSQSIISARPFWSMMSLVQSTGRYFSEGIFAEPYAAKTGAQIVYTNAICLAVYEDARAEIGRRIFVPRPRNFRPPGFSRILKRENLVTVAENNDEVTINYTNGHNKPRSVQAAIPASRISLPDWKDNIYEAEFAPISALSEGTAKDQYGISAQSAKKISRACDGGILQFTLLTKSGPAWGLISERHPIVGLVMAFLREDDEPPKGGFLNYDSFPKAPVSELPGIERRVRDLVA